MVSKAQFAMVKKALSWHERKLIAFYEVTWGMGQRIPSVEEVAAHIKQNVTSVNYYLQREPVVKALKARGIPYEDHARDELTPTQVATAITLSNFADTRSNSIKLREMGVSSDQFMSWLRIPQFKNALDTFADQNIRNIKPAAIGELTKKINDGDWQAVKYYLDTTGALAPNNVPESAELIKIFIEVIQRHVKDPKAIIAIANDLELVAANRKLEAVNPSPRSITSEVVSSDEVDEDLVRAKTMLGFG